ncbi:LysR substrate-binding domain-containing protein [Pseudomonas sp. KNUC1026]|uniref:LysR substrate-binding domain-containing protein n=1 Tax=Pseudomonas sp. KNUC1026 TaxID=2893890 RepID=UPI001F2E6B44|nr:LysR substrate-binding domain-containing protein [Pseudomonas sp. KNUC1026]UFH50070.1 LysR substrate-binding domain-containing protein [Pseudomonas sp. KNUC1026]
MSSSRTLPPLNALRTFEAAARLLSFKRAADELCVTQAAVSRQVQTLEAYYRLKLFERGNRRVALTPEGQKLLEATQPAFTLIAAASRQLLQAIAEKYLPLLTTSAFAQRWLLPRLGRLRQANPSLHLQLISSEANPDYREGFDAAITLGLEEHSAYEATWLFSEEVFPVCTPAFLDGCPALCDLQGLAHVPLLDLSARHWQPRLWAPVDWAYWFRHFGLPPAAARQAMSFSHFSLQMDAVMQGEGVGLAWRHLVQPQVDRGELVMPLPHTLHLPERRHYFVSRIGADSQREIEWMRQWLLDETLALRGTGKQAHAPRLPLVQ